MICCLVLTAAHPAVTEPYGQQGTPSERQFEKGFKKRYSSKKYDYEGQPTAYPKTQKSNTQAQEYSDNAPNLVDDDNYDALSINLDVLDGLLVMILIVAILFLAFFLVTEGNIKLFSSKSNKKIQSETNITAQNIAGIDINTLIVQAENKKDFRLAIRYYYLLVLKQLSLKNFIKYEDDKTNADYMNAIATQKFNDQFAYSSYLYNYTWYGEFPLNHEQYQLAKVSFVQLLKAINS